MADDSLETPLDPELLRAVPLQVCLQGIGKHWKRSLRRSTSDGDSSFGVNTYGMSRKTDRIDYFFSHDWETSRVLKWLSLLVMFNAPAAAMVMLSVTSLLSILAAVGSIPNMLWPLLPLLAAISYFVTLGFWQKLRSLWRKQPLVFLDRLCIAQHDVALKERGIRGLGCFLAKSQNLTILWSGRYFSRLWCLYELASYLKNERLQEKRHIQILPVHLCLLLLISCLQSTAWIVVILIFRSMDQRPNSSPVLHQLFGRGGAAFIPLSLYVGLGCMTRLYELPDQLRHFRVQDAQCFCCSNDHRHPETGKELPCDRKLVFSALEKWFGDGSSESESWIHHFNLMVRAKLSSRIAGTVGRGLPPFSYVLSTVCMSPLPFIAFFLPASLRKLAEDDDDGGKESDDDDGEGKWQGMLLELLVPPLYGVWCLLLIIQACRLVFYIFHGCGVSTLPLATSRGRRASLALLMSPIIWAILVFGIWVPLLGEYSDDLELPAMARFTLYLAYWALAAAIFLMPQLNCGTQTPQGPEPLESLSLEHSFGSVGRSSDPGDSRDPKVERVGVVKALADSGDLPPWELMKTPPFRCEDKENAEDAEEEEMVSVRF